DSMVFMGDGSPEERHNAIAHDLIDGPLIAMDRRDHPFQHRIEQLPRFLRIAIGQQLHGSLQIGKEHRDLLAFAFERTAGGENLLREIRWGVGEWCWRWCFSWRCSP